MTEQHFMDCQWAKVVKGKNGAKFSCSKGHALPAGLSVNGMLHRGTPAECKMCQTCVDFLSVEAYWLAMSRLQAFLV